MRVEMGRFGENAGVCDCDREIGLSRLAPPRSGAAKGRGMRIGLMGSVLLVLALAGPAAASITIPPDARVDLDGGRVALAGGDITSQGALRLASGELADVGDVRLLAGNADLGSGQVTLLGDWENRATVIAGSSVVTFRDGPAALRRILGNASFATLSLVSANGSRYRLESGSTQRIATVLQIIGTGVPIQIDVTAPGSIARLDLLPGGTQDIANVGVSDVYAVGQPLAPALANQGGRGNATGWFGSGTGGPGGPGVPVPQPTIVPTLSDGGLLLLALLFAAIAWRRHRRDDTTRLRA